jgi:hypothetical protein
LKYCVPSGYPELRAVLLPGGVRQCRWLVTKMRWSSWVEGVGGDVAAGEQVQGDVPDAACDAGDGGADGVGCDGGAVELDERDFVGVGCGGVVAGHDAVGAGLPGGDGWEGEGDGGGGGGGAELDAADADLPEVEGDGAVGGGQGDLEV